jgi:hypothetical protein
MSIELKNSEKVPKDFVKILEKLAYQAGVPSCSMLFESHEDALAW